MENYVLINTQTNVVDNVVYWDGNTDQWSPPPSHIALIQAKVPAKVWGFDDQTKEYILVEEVGAGQIGFTWDGVCLTTNEPKPVLEIPIAVPEQPETTGTQTI